MAEHGWNLLETSGNNWNCWIWLEISGQGVEMAGNGWEWLEVAGMAQNGSKQLELAGNYWNGWKWLEMVAMAVNGCKWLEWLEHAGKGWKGLERA